MKKILKELSILILNTPLFVVSKIIPKINNIWVFGSWYGERYADNSRALFEYIKNKQNDVRPIWITNNKQLLDRDVFYKYSLKGIYYSLISNVNIITHSVWDDINYFANDGRVTVQLWHGIPIKKIGFDDKIFAKRKKKSKVKKIKEFIFPFAKERYSLIISASSSEQKNIKTAFLSDEVKITGHPRTDVLLKSSHKKINQQVLYMPTFRNGINSEIDLFEEYGFNFIKMNNILKINDINFYIKIHPVNLPSKEIIKKIEKLSNIFIIDKDIDILLEINNYDILISDYSSVYVDYLLLDKPIIFAPFDIKKYLTKDRELYYNYNDVTPGPKCENWEKVFQWIINFSKNSELYSEDRLNSKNFFHKFQDGNSCERVYNEIQNLIKKTKTLQFLLDY